MLIESHSFYYIGATSARVPHVFNEYYDKKTFKEMRERM